MKKRKTTYQQVVGSTDVRAVGLWIAKQADGNVAMLSDAAKRAREQLETLEEFEPEGRPS